MLIELIQNWIWPKNTTVQDAWKKDKSNTTEDLPVRRCINVVVRITRSEVIPFVLNVLRKTISSYRSLVICIYYFWFLAHIFKCFHGCSNYFRWMPFFSSIGRTTAYLLNTSIATNLAPSCTMIMRCNNRILPRCFSLKLSFFSANMFYIFRSITFILLSCILHSGVFFAKSSSISTLSTFFKDIFVCVEFIWLLWE